MPTKDSQSCIKHDKIKHIIIIMQENGAFDHYFGTYPGAEGIPMKEGKPTVCLPDSISGECIRPYHDSNDSNYGGPHGPVTTLLSPVAT